MRPRNVVVIMSRNQALLAILAGADILAMPAGWLFQSRSFDVASVVWLTAAVLGLLIAVLPYPMRWTRAAFILAALGNFGSWGFIALLLYSGFTTIGH